MLTAVVQFHWGVGARGMCEQVHVWTCLRVSLTWKRAEWQDRCGGGETGRALHGQDFKDVLQGIVDRQSINSTHVKARHFAALGALQLSQPYSACTMESPQVMFLSIQYYPLLRRLDLGEFGGIKSTGTSHNVYPWPRVCLEALEHS